MSEVRSSFGEEKMTAAIKTAQDVVEKVADEEGLHSAIRTLALIVKAAREKGQELGTQELAAFLEKQRSRHGASKGLGEVISNALLVVFPPPVRAAEACLDRRACSTPQP